MIHNIFFINIEYRMSKIQPTFTKKGKSILQSEKNRMEATFQKAHMSFDAQDSSFLQKIQSRIIKTSSGIMFDNNLDIYNIILVEDDGLIYSVKFDENLYNNKVYDNYTIRVYIQQKLCLLDINKIIGVVYKTDIPEHSFWRGLAKYVYEADDGIFLKKYNSQSVITKPQAATQPPSATTKQPSPTQTPSATTKQPSPQAATQTPSATTKQRTPQAATQPSSATTKQPSLQAATQPPSANKTPRNLIKKTLTKAAYNKYKEHFENIPEQQCLNIINELNNLDINSENILKVQNPKNPNGTSKKINYDSDIILTALSKCYDKYNRKKEISDLIDIKHLVLENPSQVSNIHITDITIVNQAYKDSCDNISKKTEITYEEYTDHMQKLLKVLFTIHNIIQSDQLRIVYNFFDEETLKNYKKHVDPSYDHNKQNIITRNIIFDDTRRVTTVDNVLSNTYLNKAIRFSILKENGIKSIEFNHQYKHTENDTNYEYHKYMSVLPKYHCLDITSGISKPQNDVLLKLLLQLNGFTKDFKDNYTIIGHNKQEYQDLVSNVGDYTQNHDINKLCCVLYNNNYNKKSAIQDYYYYFNYDGPAIASSVLNAYNYINKRNSYQPLALSPPILYEIETYYKGQSPLFSRIINEGIQNHLCNDLKLDNNTFDKIKKVMQYINVQNTPNYDKEEIYVFHGTQNLMHSSRQNEMNLLSFLSCSFNIYISIDYATCNIATSSVKKNKGIVYVFKINKNMKYMNFNDGLFQILLLPGTKIFIKKEFIIGNIMYVLCHVDNNDNVNFGRKLLQNIGQNLHTPSQIKQYALTKDKKEYPICTQVALTGTRIHFRPNVENIFVIDHQNEDYIYTCLGKVLDNFDINSEFNIRYTIHQHMINDCYKFFKCNCVEYNLFYNNDNFPNNIYTAWKVDNNYNTIRDFKYNVDNFLADSILSNSDCMNSKNYLGHNTENKQMLVWLKGCGMYNTHGLRKPRFNTKDVPYDYLSILQEIMPELQRNPLLFNDLKKNINGHLDNFDSFLQNLENNYLNFIGNHTNIPHSSHEYKDMQKMIKDLTQILQYRCEYFMQHKEEINDNIIKYVAENSSIQLPSLGGDLSVSFKETRSIIQPYNTKYKTELRSSSSKRKLSAYESYRSISLPSATEFMARNLKEPYKSYYGVQNSRDIVDISNDGYCVSNKEFEKILNKLNKVV